jgi:hypothetical protein
MAFGTGPFGSSLGPTTLSFAAEERSSLSSSRKINGVTKRYELNEQGGFESMDDVSQRVLLLISFADIETPFITDRDMQEQELRLRDALRAMTTGPEPAIRLLEVSVVSNEPGVTTKTIRFQNLLTNTETTVEA